MGFFNGTLLVKVLYSTPSLFTHTELRTDLMHEGPLLILQSVLSTMCCDKQIFINTIPRLPDYSRSRHLLGLRCFIIRMPDYTDAPYHKLLGLRLYTKCMADYTDAMYCNFLVCVVLLYRYTVIRIWAPATRTYT